MKLSSIEKSELERYLSYYDFSTYIRDKTFLITGCKGLCGSGVIRWLLLENTLRNTNVRIIASTRSPEDTPAYIEPSDNITFCTFGQEAQVCRGMNIDHIIHMASPTKNSVFKEAPAETLRIIIDATENMLEIAKENSGCSMVYLSSEEVYNIVDLEQAISESYVGAVDSLSTRSCYPLGKKAAELLCYTYAVEYGVDVKIIRPTSIHGLFQTYHEERLMNQILRCVIENKNLIMKSAGETKKCIIYTLDAISAIFTVLFKGAKGQAYNASNPETFMPVRDLAVHLFEKFAPELAVEFPKEDVSVSEGYLPKRSLLQDIAKLKELGWEPKTGLDNIYEIDIRRFSESL